MLGRAQLAVGIQGQDFLEKGQGFGIIGTGVPFLRQLGDRRDILGIDGVFRREGLERIDALFDFNDVLVEFFGRGAVAPDPINFLAVPVKEQQERGSGGFEPLGYRFPDFFVREGAIENEIVVEILSELGIVVILLTQQYAAPSATRGEEVQEEELARGLGLGQGVVHRAFQPDGLGLGGRDQRDQQQDA